MFDTERAVVRERQTTENTGGREYEIEVIEEINKTTDESASDSESGEFDIQGDFAPCF